MKMWVARHEWPSGCRMLLNFYRHQSSLVIRGEDPSMSESIQSMEGVTQGCPFAMVGYGLLVLPLIRQLQREFPNVASPWYADDAMAAGALADVMAYFHRLCELGPSYGYFPEESKSILVVKARDTAAAEEFKAETKAKVKVTNGHRYLGGFVGDRDMEEAWIREQVAAWGLAVKAVGEAGKYFPQSAYAGMQRSLQQEWTFVQRVVPDIGALFDSLEDSVHGGFFSPLLGSAISKDLRDLTTTTIKLGRFSLPNPTLTSETNFTASQCETAHLINTLRDLCIFSHVKHK